MGTKSGFYLCSDSEIRYFTNGSLSSAGLIKDENDNYYYIRSSLVAVRGQEYWVSNTNGLIAEGSYYFAPDGRMVVDLGHGDDGTLYTGLRTDADGETRYYMNGVPTYAGLMLLNGDYYYFNSSKKAVRNCTYTVTKHNDLLPAGDYVFDADGKMVNPPTAEAQTGTASVMTMSATSSYQVWAPSTTTTYNYVYNGDKLSQMTVGTASLTFTYDASGSPLSVIYDTNTSDSTAGSVYYYVTNIQGDVIAILDDSGDVIAEYTYDAWGNHISTTGTMASTLGQVNPLRYRSYVYDSETQNYYLQSRYYNPKVGRFINADDYPTTGQGLTGNNMFAYCGNNPAIRSDVSGNAWETVFDLISLGTSIIEVTANPADVGAWVGLAGDIIDVAVPFVAGVGETVRAVNAGRKIADAADNANDIRKVASKIHGNSLSSKRINYGYQLIDKNNNIVKYGESKNPLTRYSKSWLAKHEYRVQIKVAGTKRGVHEWQHDMILNYTLISGGRPPRNLSLY